MSHIHFDLGTIGMILNVHCSMREGYGGLVTTSSFIFISNMQYIWLLYDILKVSDRWISLKMFCSRDIAYHEDS